MKIKAIITDVGGVLVQTKNDEGRRAWENKLRLPVGQLNKEIFEKEPGDLATIGKVSDEVIWADVKKKFALSEADIVDLKLEFYSGDRLNTDYFTYLQEVHQYYPIILLSNAWANAREIYTNRYHLNTIATEMIISAEVGLRKPNEKIFRLALEHARVDAHDVLFIDDTKENIEAAQALGMHTVYFIHTQDAIKQIKEQLEY